MFSLSPYLLWIIQICCLDFKDRYINIMIVWKYTTSNNYTQKRKLKDIFVNVEFCFFTLSLPKKKKRMMDAKYVVEL